MEKIIIRMRELKDIFISFEPSSKSQVMVFGEKLKKLGFKVWRDERDYGINDKSLICNLANAIKKSKLFVCCVTENYCKSHNCNLEIEWANTLGKPIVVLMIDRLKPEEILNLQVSGRGQASEIGFIIK